MRIPDESRGSRNSYLRLMFERVPVFILTILQGTAYLEPSFTGWLQEKKGGERR